MSHSASSSPGTHGTSQEVPQKVKSASPAETNAAQPHLSADAGQVDHMKVESGMVWLFPRLVSGQDGRGKETRWSTSANLGGTG